MAKGYFVVTQDGDNLDILYKVAPDAKGDCPDDQLALKNALEATEAALKVLYPDDGLRRPRFRELLSLAQVGLEGDNADPKVAAAALANLKQSILVTEGGARKNHYLKKLGTLGAGFAAPPLVAAVVLQWLHVCWTAHSFPCEKYIGLFVHFCLLWVGAIVGAWVSYGLRTETLTFEDLMTPEEDRLEPGVRLIFVGVLALVTGLALYVKLLEISFGTISSRDFVSRTGLALLIGFLMGSSERALSGQVNKLAVTLSPTK
ncbi:MAG TPA: hypothetical protein VGR92_04345 [Steroidobacteraceae bacterium]|nr:hypothetical protein [Steroidobacteraceae bacterium]